MVPYKNMKQAILESRMQQVLYDVKWKKFLTRSAPWRFIPCVEFVLAGGSMVMGDVHENSDFDVTVAAAQGRIFTARFFSILVFGALGWRRPKLSHKDEAKDKICLNHFVTAARFRLAPPHNAYWRELYRHLVPVFGEEETINEFFQANAEWMEGARVYRDDLRHQYRRSSRVKLYLEKVLRGPFGEKLEHYLKKFQVMRIEKSLKHDPSGYKPRIRFSDEELEFHPDTTKAETFLKKTKG